MSPFVASRFAPFGTTIFAEMTALANQHGAVNLSQGFPDFEGPDFIKHAAAEAFSTRPNQYGRMQGVPELNAALAKRWAHLTGQAIDGEAQITVTSGCTEALAATFLGLFNPGDEVIFFEPYYDAYAAGAAMAGATVRAVTLRTPGTAGGRADAFSFDPDELRRAFSPRTRAIVVNTPHNPTGKVFSREELGLIARECVARDVVAITDEVYETLAFDAALPHVRLATMPGMQDRTITLSSLGKSYSLTGWKIGWAIASPALTRAVRSAHQFLTFCAPVPLQHGAARALEIGGAGDAYISSLAAELRSNRDFLDEHLRRAGFRTFPSPGGYFIVADHTPVSRRVRAASGTPAARGAHESGMDDMTFARWMTTDIGVATIPCSVFYTNKDWGRPLIRFNYGKRRQTLEAGVARLARLASL